MKSSKLRKMTHRLSLFLLLMLATTSSAFAQGRDITPQDWADRLPIFFIVIVVVLFVDWLFIRSILKDRRENKDRIK